MAPNKRKIRTLIRLKMKPIKGSLQSIGLPNCFQMMREFSALRQSVGTMYNNFE